MIEYTTKLKHWQELLKYSEGLDLQLPPEIGARKWDVVFVDAPAGFDDDSPGRMQSIYCAAQLAKPGGDVFVHDSIVTLSRDTARIFSAMRIYLEYWGRYATSENQLKALSRAPH